MNSSIPPPISRTPRKPLDRPTKVLIGLSLVAAIFVGALMILRIVGLVRPFSVPTGAMKPAVSPGDHIMMEGITFLARKPQRGDVVVFNTDGIASLPSGTIQVKRVAEEPGDHLKISDGQLYVNDKLVALSNAWGKIVYPPPPIMAPSSLRTNVTISEGYYFVLGDNSTNSYDSRFWGSVPRENILGRVSFCYWPPRRVGRVK